MKIEQLLEKKEHTQVIILRLLLLSGGSELTSRLQSKLGLSKATLDSYIADLNQFTLLGKNIISIEETRKEIHLTLTPQVNLDRIIAEMVVDSAKFQILEMLLVKKDVTSIQFSHRLSLSESTVFRKIKELNLLLSEFDFQIKNGQFFGEELQIRYFFFDLYQFLTPIHQTDFLMDQQTNQTLIRALEKTLHLTFNEHAKGKLNFWIGITLLRLSVKRQHHTRLKKISEPYKEDLLYKNIDKVITLFFSRTSIELNKYESMMFFMCVLTFFILDEEQYYQYDLLRQKRQPTATLDIFIREMMLIDYKPNRLTIEHEKKIGYFLSQINNGLYFFQGKIDLFSKKQQIDRQHLLIGENYNELIATLTSTAFEQLGQPYSENNTRHKQLPIHYGEIISMIGMYMTTSLTVAIDFSASPHTTTLFKQVLVQDLQSIPKVNVIDYEEQASFDFLITIANHTPKQYNRAIPTYHLSEFASDYDLIQIKKIINQLIYHK